jgi:hypothetical protein
MPQPSNLPLAIRSYILNLIRRDSEFKQAIVDAVKEAERREKRFPRS